MQDGAVLCVAVRCSDISLNTHLHLEVLVAIFTTSQYIKKEQLPVKQDLPLTIAGYVKEEVGTDKEPKQAWVLSFEEVEERLILNKTKGDAIAAAVGGSYDMDDWVGKKIALYVDPNIMYSGKKVGGIAVRETLVA